jgi:hypothetical protein
MKKLTLLVLLALALIGSALSTKAEGPFPPNPPDGHFR